MSSIISSARTLVGVLDAAALSPERAVSLLEQFSALEKLAAAGRTLAAGRVASTRAWRASGASSATAFLAQRAGTALSDATATLQTAASLDALPAVREALVSGKLSDAQAAEIAAAAAVDPGSEPELLAMAERESFSALRERCRDVRAATTGDEDAAERIRRGRYARHWTERSGAVRLEARLAPDDAAPLVAAISAGAERLRAEARRSVSHAREDGGAPGALEPRALEPAEAYAADALVALATGGARVKTVVHVHVSQTALARGHTVAGETCRIQGIGPIPVASARRLALGGEVKLLETDGVDVGRVVHTGRTIPARLRTALETRDPTCVVPGCHRRQGLEIDHVVPLARGGQTSLANLARLCRWHHAQKTHHGWRLSWGPDGWVWSNPRRDRSPPDRGG